jgi:hypothetical protein
LRAFRHIWTINNLKIFIHIKICGNIVVVGIALQ